jgi:hypothetical protein
MNLFSDAATNAYVDMKRRQTVETRTTRQPGYSVEKTEENMRNSAGDLGEVNGALEEARRRSRVRIGGVQARSSGSKRSPPGRGDAQNASRSRLPAVAKPVRVLRRRGAARRGDRRRGRHRRGELN